MYLRTLTVPLKNDVSYKFTLCHSYRDKTSGKAKYISRYITSIRKSALEDVTNPLARQKFWLKFRMKLDALGIPRDSDQFELLRINIYVIWEKLGFAV